MDVVVHQVLQVGGDEGDDGVHALHVAFGKRLDGLIENVHALEMYRVRARRVALLVLRQLCLDDVGVQYERANGLAVRVDNAGGFSRCRQAEHQLHPVIRLQGPS